MSCASVDIEANAGRYLAGRRDTGRYASFDYCLNYFQSFHDDGRVDELVAQDQLQTSCLQLGFYLASWGMFRGKADLLNHSAKRLAPVIAAIAAAPDAVWSADANDYGPPVQRLLFGVADQLRVVLPGGQSQTLVTKTMLGVFGCVPAYDRFFKVGFGAATFGPKSLRGIEAFYLANAERLDRYRVATLDFATGGDTARLYSRAKVIDMVFFTEGLSGRAARSEDVPV